MHPLLKMESWSLLTSPIVLTWSRNRSRTSPPLSRSRLSKGQKTDNNWLQHLVLFRSSRKSTTFLFSQLQSNRTLQNDSILVKKQRGHRRKIKKERFTLPKNRPQIQKRVRIPSPPKSWHHHQLSMYRSSLRYNRWIQLDHWKFDRSS